MRQVYTVYQLSDEELEEIVEGQPPREAERFDYEVEED